LVVDDTPFNIEVIQAMLRLNFGLTSEAAYSGEQAVNIVQERNFQGYEPFKLIIMDINMHEMDGV
jgi:CheY-like chemotaxis protein